MPKRVSNTPGGPPAPSDASPGASKPPGRAGGGAGDDAGGGGGVGVGVGEVEPVAEQGVGEGGFGSGQPAVQSDPRRRRVAAELGQGGSPFARHAERVRGDAAADRVKQM